MENAQKALIIAAAVLIAILLITIGIKIFSSTSNTIQDTHKVGMSVSEGVSSATSSLSDEFDRLNGYDVNRYKDENVEVNNYYKNYVTPIRFELGKTYKISFDYIIKENPDKLTIGCSIGYGNNNYNDDYVYKVSYNDSTTLNKKMRFDYEFTESEEFNKHESLKRYINDNNSIPFLCLRLARIEFREKRINVEISNLKISKK